jgi:hypothetical protein
MPQLWSHSAVFQMAVLLLLLLVVALVIPPPSPVPPHVTVMPLHLRAPAETMPTAAPDVF